MNDGSSVSELIYAQLEASGYRGRIIPIRYRFDLQRELVSNYTDQLLDEVFYQERLTHLNYEIPEALSDARSIIITAVPQPQQKVEFIFNNRTVSVIVPPTYDSGTDDKIQDLLSAILQPEGFSLHPAVLPLKLLAVYSGLAEYGRNNIVYVDGMGSFHRLQAFFSDLPVTEENWFELKSLKKCAKCTACIDQCPTKAILADRFLIRAERCLTFHNERFGDFPDWIEASWHNCLIGCMHCQIICPENKRFRNWFTRPEVFNEEESQTMLSGVNYSHLSEENLVKLRQFGFWDDDVKLLPRNLKALLVQHQSA